MASFPSASSIVGQHSLAYETFYSQVDQKGAGVVGALQAAAFLKKSGLKESVLSDIWELSDPGGKGALDKHAFFVALKLISAVQNGNKARLDSLTLNLPPPLFKGVSTKNKQNDNTVINKLSPPSSKANNTINNTNNINNNNNNKLEPDELETNHTNTKKEDIINVSEAGWSIPLKERVKYDHIFDTLGPLDNLLPGAKVRPVLLNSKLPVDTLGHVWDLSDIDGDGSLDREEFSVAMHLVYKALQKIDVPKELPPELVPPSKRRGEKKGVVEGKKGVVEEKKGVVEGKKVVVEEKKVAQKLPKRNSMSNFKKDDSLEDDAFDDLAKSSLTNTPAAGVVSAKMRKGSLNLEAREERMEGVGGSTLARCSSGSTVGWVVTPQTKSYCDKLFLKADTDKDGYLNGLEIKKIFVTSGLPQATLAKIWNLCDNRNMGKLNKDQFALAMHLIQSRLKGNPLPSKLTPSMLPPSSRRNSLGDSAPPPGVVYDMKTSGMKEIDALVAEIEELKMKKKKLEGEKAELDGGVQAVEKGVAGTQKEIEVVVDAVKQLNKQRNEAQKKLIELDEKKSQCGKACREVEGQLEKEAKKILELKEQLKNRDNLNKSLEEDLRSKRDELGVLREQEMELETKFEGSHRRLVQISKLLHASQMQLSQIEFNVEKLHETKRQIEVSNRAYDQLMVGQISEVEANAIIDHQVTSPTLDLDFSSSDMMSDMVQTSQEDMHDFQKTLSAIHSGEGFETVGVGGVDDDEEESAKNEVESADASKDNDVEASDPQDTKKSEDLWEDVPFAKAPASNDPFAIGFITTDTMADISTEDPFGQGSFIPPSLKPARPSRPPQHKQASPGAAPNRPKSPLPARPKSPAPPRSPCKQGPPSRPPAPGKSPSKSPLPAFGDRDDFFSKDQFDSDFDLK